MKMTPFLTSKPKRKPSGLHGIDDHSDSDEWDDEHIDDHSGTHTGTTTTMTLLAQQASVERVEQQETVLQMLERV